jgi:hypothetical protein
MCDFLIPRVRTKVGIPVIYAGINGFCSISCQNNTYWMNMQKNSCFGGVPAGASIDFI